MRIHIIQHVPFEGPAKLGELLQSTGATISFSYLFENTSFPSVKTVDRLVVLGGPMGVHDASEYPWLELEIQFIQEVLRERRKKILGICLGAQLIAHALGSEVVKNPQKEIGFFPTYRAPVVPHRWERIFPSTFDPFHWHGDTFFLPQGAVALAYSAACANQAFVWKNKALALQFHLEGTAKSIEDMIAHEDMELNEKGKYIQNKFQIRENGEKYLPASERILQSLLSWFL
jgi:GMP synthase-like glutamine amidotransferase